MTSMVEMWTDQVGDMVLIVNYDSEKNMYHIEVRRGEESRTTTVEAVYVPRFGIDNGDMQDILAAAEKLALDIEHRQA